MRLKRVEGDVGPVLHPASTDVITAWCSASRCFASIWMPVAAANAPAARLRRNVQHQPDDADDDRLQICAGEQLKRESP